MSNKIVIPYDFTDAGNAAVNYGVEVARHLEGELLLLHVTAEIPGADANKEALHAHPMYKGVTKNLAEVADKIEDEHGIQTFYKIEEGNLFESIASVAQGVNAILIILATHGVRGIQHFLGSYAGKVINSTEIPVLVTQEHAVFNRIKNIIIPLHEEEDIENVSKWGAVFASRFTSVVHIIQSKHFQNKELDRQFTLESFHELLNDNKVSYVDYLEENDSKGFEDCVESISKSVEADLIVIEASKDEGKHKIGKEAQHFITNEYEIPVLVLDPEFGTRDIKAQIELRLKY